MGRDGILFALAFASGAVLVPEACGGSGTGSQGMLLDGGPDGTGSGGTSGDSTIVCVPESIELCTGSNDCAGVRTCNLDGLAWSDCTCGAASGMGGTGGGSSLQDVCATGCQTMATLGCPNFDLALCMSDCETTSTLFPECPQEYDALLRCLATSPASAWACTPEGDTEYVDTARCQAQADLLNTCLAAGTGGGSGVGGTSGTGGASGVCTDTCVFASDGECDDGGPGYITDFCDYGTDCSDCGPR